MTDFPPVSPLPPVQQPPSNSPTTALVLGILSIVLGWPVVGLVLGILAVRYSKRAEREIAAGLADKGGAGAAKAGFICGVIGLVISAMSTLAICLYFSCVGLALFGAAAGSAHHP